MNRSCLGLVSAVLVLGLSGCGTDQPSAATPGSGGDAGVGTSTGGVSGTGGSATGGVPGASGGGSNSGGNSAEGAGGASTGSVGGSASGGAGGVTSGGTGGGLPGGSGGVSSGGSPMEAELVTSAEGDYWNESTLSESTSGTATWIVDDSTLFQSWDGFGGTFNEKGWDALSVVSDQISHAMTLLFGAEYAGFVYGRIPMAASDYSMSWYTYAETADDYVMENFTIERDREMMIPYIRAALAVQPDLRLWGSPWVIPNWLMQGRSIRTEPQALEAHALYFARFVEEYDKEGLTIEAVHLQNEPGYGRVGWDDQVFIDFFKTYLGPKFVERDVSAEIWCGTISHPDKDQLALSVANDPESMEVVTGFGLQWNHEDTVASLVSFGPVMQTEHRCGNYNFEAKYWDQSRYDPSSAQNDHLYGEESWQLIRDWLVGGVNSYLAWNMVLDTRGLSLDNWPQNALLVVDRDAQELIVTPAYYVFRHFSHFIRPGATRVALTGTDDAVAFVNADGSIVVQAYNSGESSLSTTVKVGTRLYDMQVPPHGWATLRSLP